MISAQEALERLREGNRRFVSGVHGRNTFTSQTRRSELAAGQEPFAIILGCSDSRVPAEIVFDQGLGDLFVIRVAVNIVASSQIGSVEFAAAQFGTRLVVVLGHSQCAAVLATFGRTSEIDRKPVTEHTFDPPSRQAIRGSVAGDRTQAQSRCLGTASRSGERSRLGKPAATWIANLEQLIQKAGLFVVGAEYSLETEVVEFFDGIPEVG